MPENGQKSERRTALPYYRWWVQDYRGSRNVQRLTWQERGIYRELLDECWDKGSIPDDLDALADIVGCERWEIEQPWTKLRKLFEEGPDGRMTSPRLEKERSAEDRERLLKAAAGRKGGLASGVSRGKQGSGASVLGSNGTKHEASSSEQFISNQSSSGAGGARPLGGLTPAQCPWCRSENGHAPDCRPARLSPGDAAQ